jgi:hypothetical protein
VDVHPGEFSFVVVRMPANLAVAWMYIQERLPVMWLYIQAGLAVVWL